jgi:hypothetical protein
MRPKTTILVVQKRCHVITDGDPRGLKRSLVVHTRLAWFVLVLGMEVAHFSLPVAIVTMAIGLSSNLIKSYSGFGGGILFVSLMKVASTAGLLGEEGHERGLGGMAGNLALVTVMETFTTCPLAIYERNNVHWPLFMALMVGSILMVPVGTSFLMGTLDDEGGDEYAMLLKKCFGVLIICFVAVQVRCARPGPDRLKPYLPPTPYPIRKLVSHAVPTARGLEQAPQQTIGICAFCMHKYRKVESQKCIVSPAMLTCQPLPCHLLPPYTPLISLRPTT